MRWAVWDRVERLLLKYRVRPILAVVPDNHDPKLKVDPPREDFWPLVREWQSRGWTIALHGYQHRYVSSSAGIIGLNRRSEFAGRPEPAQREALTKAMEIMGREEVSPSVWVAPAHSFDGTTLAILQELGVRTISDGYGRYPYRDDRGLLWIPQQLWEFHRRSKGVWTVCIHMNHWRDADIERFERDVDRFTSAIVDVPAVEAAFGQRRRSLGDLVDAASMRASIKLRRAAWRLKNRGR